MSLFRSCQEISQADFRFLEECLAEKEESEGITDILLERLVMKGWEIYQGGRRNDVEILKLSELSYRAPGSCSVTASVCSLRSQCWTRWM